MGDPSSPTFPTSADSSRPIVYVTGFGPFGLHHVNASQSAVEMLPTLELEELLKVKLVTEIIPVEYEAVTKLLPLKWKELKPKLVVHVGVSGTADVLTLEQQAHNSRYDRKDVKNCVPDDCCCVSGQIDVLKSEIQMNLVSHAINQNTDEKALPCIVSHDPGRFLCDFIYFTSLNEDRKRSAFIHVPTLDKVNAEVLASAIASAIIQMYQQVVKLDNESLNCQQ